MRMLNRAEAALHWREDGDPSGRPLVFANSLGTDLRLWDDVVAHLPAGLKLIRYDMRGHGLSDCPRAPYAMGAMVHDLEGLLDALVTLRAQPGIGRGDVPRESDLGWFEP